jgi:uracil-DNA glycosylase family 4
MPNEFTYDDAERIGCKCSACPLRLDGQGPVAPEGPATATYAIIGEAPGPKEISVGRPFIGPSGVLLNDMLEAAGRQREHVWVTNAVLCLAPGDLHRYRASVRLDNKNEKKAAKKENREPEIVLDPVTACRPRLLAELERVARNAKLIGLRPVVTPTGGVSLEAITGKKLSIMRWRGSEIRATLETKRAAEATKNVIPAARLGRRANV